MQIDFSLGGLFLTPPGTNPTPVQFGLLNDISIDFSGELKEMRGQNMFMFDAAIGPSKITGKAKFAQIHSAILAAAFTGETVSNGSVVGVWQEAGTIPGTPYQITVANGATFKDDLGVLDLTSNIVPTRVASAPATGQYSVNTATGQYTFAAADTTHKVAISYTYTAAGAGKTINMKNQLMGQATAYQLTVFNNYAGKNKGLKFYSVYMPKLTFAMKVGDWAEQDIEFVMGADSTGNIFDSWLAE